MQKRGRGHVTLRQRRVRVVAMPSKLGVHEKIFSSMNCDSVFNDSYGFTSSRFLILFLAFPCSASLSLSPDSDNHLSSINQLCSSYTLYVYGQTDIFHIASRNVKCGWRASVQYLIQEGKHFLLQSKHLLYKTATIQLCILLNYSFNQDLKRLIYYIKSLHKSSIYK